MSIAAAFDTFNPARLKSSILESVWKNGFGDDYAAEAQPNAFYAQSALDEMARHATGSVLLDIGCGHGQTGAYLANKLDMSLMGIDISPASIEVAKQNNGKFWVAPAESTGLSEQVDTVICMDVMLYLDKPAAIKEITRILRPGGILAFTTWEQKGYIERLGAEQINDYRPLLSDFEILVYESRESWTIAQGKVLTGLVSNEAKLKQEIGDRPAEMYAGMARAAIEESPRRRYVLVIARRKAS